MDKIKESKNHINQASFCIVTYAETLDYLFTALPMYQRVGAVAFKKDLTNTLALCEACGNPHQKIKTVHVAGTNGKGSTTHFLAAILQASGYKVGVYTSPHYRDFRERIKINGVYIPENAVINFVKKYKTDFERIQPSFFEMTVAMAFDYFATENVDIAIIEVGLGGRLDSTNVITPLLSVITNISLDHQDMLGDTLPLIAAEKAGIIKSKIPVIISETQVETQEVFLAKAQENLSPIVFAETQFSIKNIETAADKLKIVLERNSNFTPKNAPFTLFLDATGAYQVRNLRGVLTAADWLKPMFNRLNDETIATGLANVKRLTNMIGRWQILTQMTATAPLTIADSGHNEGGLSHTMPQLTRLMHEKKADLHFVLGVVRDKEIDKMLGLLPKNARYYFAKADIPRGMPADELQEKAQKHGLQGSHFASIASALSAAKSAAKLTDIVFVGGSCFTVAEVI